MSRVATEADILPPGAGGMPRMSEPAAIALNAVGVRASVIRMPQVHDEEKQGFASYLLAHARGTGVSAFVAEGKNRWPAVHRQDAARLYGLVLSSGKGGQRYHAVSEEAVSFHDIASAIAERLAVPLVSMSSEESARHFGWLDRIAQMDVPASSNETQAGLNWHPSQPANLIQDILKSS
jgi:nucleoside-diphosphate-sugar epimerase